MYHVDTDVITAEPLKDRTSGGTKKIKTESLQLFETSMSQTKL